jgi:hypothetical protein
MTVGKTTSFAIIVAALGVFIVPALAQNGSSDMQRRHDPGTSMGRGMMGGGMMSGSMMGDCMEMMQSMDNGGDGRPDSQWQKHRPSNRDKSG